MASIDNPAASTEMRLLAASLRVDMRDSDSATYIDLSRTDTIEGVTALETYGIIGVGRAVIILTTPIQQVERPLNHSFE